MRATTKMKLGLAKGKEIKFLFSAFYRTKIIHIKILLFAICCYCTSEALWWAPSPPFCFISLCGLCGLCSLCGLRERRLCLYSSRIVCQETTYIKGVYCFTCTTISKDVPVDGATASPCFAPPVIYIYVKNNLI